MATLIEIVPKLLLVLLFAWLFATLVAPRNVFAMSGGPSKYPNRVTLGTEDRVQEHPTHSSTGDARPEFPDQPDVDENPPPSPGGKGPPPTPTDPGPPKTPVDPGPPTTPTEPPVKK